MRADGERGAGAEVQRVAVGRRLGHHLGTQRAGRPHGHRLAARPQTRFVETLDEHHISLAEGSALASLLPPLARAIGRNLSFRIQVSSFESICLLVEAGVGIGIIPRSSALRHARTMKLQIVSLTDEWARRETKVVNRARTPLPKLAQALIRHLANFNVEERLL
ncbi:LysR substrate-binding domain-containing protein [Schlegelella sp. S2-27]|uniref:LysR substrate-binding domain-containing protein n=1 Tax=Caldimonas mangrovi TaxID=2944811 RepID=A0ABT0YS13_9BURK|nr:LysR substrate-binding domain-containing protein [Caldimonas mangrovi]